MRYLWLIFSLILSSCGYGLQGSKNLLLEKEGIKTVYVESLENQTFKAGVENLVYNELVRALMSHRTVRVVSKPEHADAIISGAVTQADYSSVVQTPASNITPLGTGPATRLVTTRYQVILTCSFGLRKRTPSGEEGIWSSSFARAKQFPANNQLGALGTTSALINESEFDRALQDLSAKMMGEVHESMLGLF